MYVAVQYSMMWCQSCQTRDDVEDVGQLVQGWSETFTRKQQFTRISGKMFVMNPNGQWFFLRT